MIEFVKGDMFEVGADFLINTVNCNGVMGKGVALEFKKRFPEMFKAYRSKCKNGLITPGSVTLHKIDRYNQTSLTIANFATKKDWWNPSRYQHITIGLYNLEDILVKQEYKNAIVAMPPVGCGNGGLDWNFVKPKIIKRLSNLPQQIYIFEPQ